MADRERWLTSAEAARRLGVQPATLYAYVSRGLIDRERAVDGRTSRFRHRDVEAMAAGRSRSGGRRATTGFAVVTTELTHLDDRSLTYRGHDVAELARRCSFEEVAELLWGADVTSSSIRSPWSAPPLLRDISAAATSALPADAHTPDVLRVGVAAVAAVDDGRFALDRTAVAATARRLITAPVLSLPLRRSGPSTGPVAAMLWPRLSERTPEPPTFGRWTAHWCCWPTTNWPPAPWLCGWRRRRAPIRVRACSAGWASCRAISTEVRRHRCTACSRTPVSPSRSSRRSGICCAPASGCRASVIRCTGWPIRGWRRCGKP